MSESTKSSPFDTLWIDAHRDCERLSDEREALSREKRDALALARKCEVHRRLGFRSFGEYVDFLFGDLDASEEEDDDG